ncbi:MAG: GTPase [Gemmatimonadota bacterium]
MLSVGIGLPNVGKSSLVNALSSAKAEAATYPFCTAGRERARKVRSEGKENVVQDGDVMLFRFSV